MYINRFNVLKYFYIVLFGGKLKKIGFDIFVNLKVKVKSFVYCNEKLSWNIGLGRYMMWYDGGDFEFGIILFW